MCRRIPMDYACGAITLGILEPCHSKRAGKPCQVISTQKQISLMPCAKHHASGRANVPAPGPIFQAHADCQPPPEPRQWTRPMPVSPTQRGIFPLVPGLLPGQTAVHPGILGMRNYQAHETNAMMRKRSAERREKAGVQHGAENWHPDNRKMPAPLQRSTAFNPIMAPETPVPQPTTFHPRRAAPPIPVQHHTADPPTANPASAITAPRTPAPRLTHASESPLISHDKPFRFAAIKEAPLAEARKLKGVAAWVARNTTYYDAEQAATARADAEAIGAEQVRVLEEVRREEAVVGVRGGGVCRQRFEEVEGIAVGGWEGFEWEV